MVIEYEMSVRWNKNDCIVEVCQVIAQDFIISIWVEKLFQSVCLAFE